MRSRLVEAIGCALILSTFGVYAASGVSAQPAKKATKSATKPAPAPAAEVATVKQASDMPKVSTFEWSELENLGARVVSDKPVVSGQPVLRLMPAGSGEKAHYAAARFSGTSKKPYRITAWVKPEAGAGLFMEARDAGTGAYGAATFDLAAKKVESSTGDIAQTVVEAGPNGWLKASTTLRPATDAILVVVFVTKGGSKIFNGGDGKVALMLGGIEAKP